MENKNQYSTDCSCCETSSESQNQSPSLSNTTNNYKLYLPAIFSFILLMVGLGLDYTNASFFSGWIRVLWYVAAYLPVGYPVIKQGYLLLLKGNFFSEFTLMAVATIGAFAIGEYPEGVAVMLFYSIGELFQGAAVRKAKGNIRSLLNQRSSTVMVYDGLKFVAMKPEHVNVGSRIQIKVGEKLALDGVLNSEMASMNTSAITGESVPKTIRRGEKVYAGYINTDQVIEMESTKKYQDSSIARILEMVEQASARKSKTELFIRRFAKIYTPIVFFAALAITLLPYLFVDNYVFEDWLYKGLIFLVLSCPCALVVSIPLGYFGGLGAASRNGLLFKGASFLDAITKVNTLAMDKTGTLTKGNFKIQSVVSPTMEQTQFLNYIKSIESQSSHPIAKAILNYNPRVELTHQARDVKEIPGQGLSGYVNGHKALVGNLELMMTHQVRVPEKTKNIVETVVFMALEGVYSGHIIIADQLKDDAKTGIERIKATGITNLMILSGDKQSITSELGNTLDVSKVKGDLFPEDKLKEVEKLKEDPESFVAFVGDGINDAPVLAMSDVGIAMGGLGSDVAIETADIVIQTDQISKIATAIEIGKSTRNIVWQNIALAFGVKLMVLLMGAWGVASMWEAVFADVGVAFLAILNAVRLQQKQWK
ncbi:heavy metal-translocating P-type ATPase [Galbibacter marinus]|uniref:P-type Zn(2+) transporter n=1 Tax=Galbibacter marinus TaxID=555500 RepID=K2PWY1_9FLAO|nr:heavy metal translocating P-type ATPase [Galbibacter marinus]EKF55984.1 heavy metal-translocating P-type ATPase [Galbibacter marinus]